MSIPGHDVFPELLSLLDALCEETITSEQCRRLEELVLAHPEAEAYYVQHMAFYADLVRHFQDVARPTVRLPDPDATTAAALPAVPGMIPSPARAAAATAPATTAPAAATGKGRRLMRWGLAGLATAAGLFLAVSPWSPPRVIQQPSQAVEALDQTVAVLSQALGAVWERTTLSTHAGAPLSPGWLRLKAGTVQVEFYNGAVVILEGPTDFKLISRHQAYCAMGKLRAMVPPQATGFTIGSPKLNVVDLGTEFGLQVGAEGKTDVHVFQGKVELHDAAADRNALPLQELNTGQSVRLEGAATVRAIKQDSAAFPSAQELALRLQAEVERRKQSWLTASAALRKDRDLLVYYTFANDEPWSRNLLDQANQRLQPRDGVIIGCSWLTGRWPGKQGLEFKRVSDRVRFHVPGSYEAMTLMAWVRVDTLRNRNNSLMMTDGWDPGGLHWQIGEGGTVILGVQSRPKGKGAHYHAPEVFTPDRFAQWVHLAVVYDQENSQVTHYVDGQPAAQTAVLFDIPLVVGNAEIGNWNVATHRNNTPVRNFNGCMDEFMMFSRALSDQEVDQLYAKGQPPR